MKTIKCIIVLTIFLFSFVQSMEKEEASTQETTSSESGYQASDLDDYPSQSLAESSSIVSEDPLTLKEAYKATPLDMQQAIAQEVGSQVVFFKNQRIIISKIEKNNIIIGGEKNSFFKLSTNINVFPLYSNFNQLFFTPFYSTPHSLRERYLPSVGASFSSYTLTRKLILPVFSYYNNKKNEFITAFDGPSILPSAASEDTKRICIVATYNKQTNKSSLLVVDTAIVRRKTQAPINLLGFTDFNGKITCVAQHPFKKLAAICIEDKGKIKMSLLKFTTGFTSGFTVITSAFTPQNQSINKISFINESSLWILMNQTIYTASLAKAKSKGKVFTTTQLQLTFHKQTFKSSNNQFLKINDYAIDINNPFYLLFQSNNVIYLGQITKGEAPLTFVKIAENMPVGKLIFANQQIGIISSKSHIYKEPYMRAPFIHFTLE